ncbi:MAG: formate dehydrogenase accessory sulfurtransferase FdhD [Candidatus Hydrothermarchaeales archaeon]
MKEVEYTRIEIGKGKEKRRGKVVLDGVVEIKVNDMKPFKMTLFPRNKVDAAIGRLFFMGLIRSMEDVLDIKEEDSSVEFNINRREKKLLEVNSNLRVKARALALCMKKLFKSTDVWELTGGVHSAGLFDSEGNLLYSADDIGKGNAIDAVIGKGLRGRADFSRCVLASTGRQIGFMIEKAVRAGIPLVISRGAPLYSSIETAEKYGITLVCFAKGRRMNVYAHEERII